MGRELSAEEIRRVCDPDIFGCETTAQLQPLTGIIGQKRALQALQFGLGIQERGFNIYASGPPGTGRTTAITAFLESVAAKKETPPDWCYVHNFRDPYRPRALRLHPSKGWDLQRDMKRLVEGAQRALSQAFEGEDYVKKRDEIIDTFNRRRQEQFTRLDERARSRGFILQSSPAGLLLIPAPEGKPLGEQEFVALSPQVKQEMAERRGALEAEVKEAVAQLRAQDREAQEQIERMNREIAHYAVGDLVEELVEKYAAFPDVVNYLREVEEDMVENRDRFRPQPEAQPPSATTLPWATERAFKGYEVNVLVDNSAVAGAPVVLEFNPTFSNLFGRIEKEAYFGALHTDFTMIREGSLHRANGGYLVIRIEDILANYLSWQTLKRALRDEKVVIEELSEHLGLVATKSLKPEPIPLDVKVILIGDPLLYYLLYNVDPEFIELFKVRADFDSRMDRTEENLKEYAAFICTLCQKEGLKHLDSSAVAKIIDHSSRLAADQEKLSTRFAEIADIIREASYWAAEEDSPYIGSSHVAKAIEQKVYRSNLIQERITEMIERGTIIIDTEGQMVGQVNGLSIVDLGEFSFGRPSRITATIAAGREGLIDIEREARLGGRIHTKGVMILSGYLADRYTQDMPLSLAARLVFEQSYEEIEGDSASSTELYALLSRLADLPIKQGIAVTGSVNQKGEVQAIGGVNQKIEGFFEVCRARGLTGSQGVIIPASNVKNLMLKEEVVEAVRQGRFHIYPVGTIDEGIEILTGEKAGQRLSDGAFEEGSVNWCVHNRLRELARGLRDFLKGEEEPAAREEE